MRVPYLADMCCLTNCFQNTWSLPQGRTRLLSQPEGENIHFKGLYISKIDDNKEKPNILLNSKEKRLSEDQSGQEWLPIRSGYTGP